MKAENIQFYSQHINIWDSNCIIPDKISENVVFVFQEKQLQLLLYPPASESSSDDSIFFLKKWPKQHLTIT